MNQKQSCVLTKFDNTLDRGSNVILKRRGQVLKQIEINYLFLSVLKVKKYPAYQKKIVLAT